MKRVTVNSCNVVELAREKNHMERIENSLGMLRLAIHAIGFAIMLIGVAYPVYLGKDFSMEAFVAALALISVVPGIIASIARKVSLKKFYASGALTNINIMDSKVQSRMH